MKLNLDQNPNLNLITGYGTDHLMINKVRHDGNLILTTARIVPWGCAGFDRLHADDLAAVCELAPEVVILGTGARLRFPSPQVLRPLIDARIGYEIMDSAAACRTYNILATEGRAVAVALIFDAA
jgi:uncharacterized protein